MGISHKWNGTVLTITSDSGTSSADLKGEKGDTGIRGAQGAPGISNGNDGYIPVKGVDYWTPEEQESIVQQVITALGTPVFGTVDADNNIILTGNLSKNTYTIKYEDAEGNVTYIGELAFIPGSQEIELTWTKNKKLDATTGAESTVNDYAYSNDIPLEDGTELVISCSDTTYFHTHWYYYTSNGTFVGKTDWAVGTTTNVVTPYPETVITKMEGADVVRLRCNTDDGNWTKLNRLTLIRRNV